MAVQDGPPSLKAMGPRKAAILIMTLEQSAASEILQKLDKRSVEQVSREIATLSDVSDEERRAVIEEFYTLGMAQTYVVKGGLQHAKKLLETAFGSTEAEDTLGAVKRSMRATPFAFLYGLETQNLLAFLHEEHPQTIALVLAHMTRNSYDPVLHLPSGGDCSYPGMVWHDGLLWMSYYSSHEGKTSIYLAKVRLNT